MRIGVVAGLALEARILGAKTLRRAEIAPICPGVDVLWAGIGPTQAEAAARQLVERGATVLLSWGTAGGLADDVLAGDLVTPDTVMAADGSVFHPNADLLARLRSGLPRHLNVRSGAMVEGTEILADSAAKREAGERSGAVAVDMESAAVGRVARECGVPFLVVRAVVDECRVTLPASIRRGNGAGEETSLPSHALAILIRPWEWLSSWRLARGFLLASRTLQSAAEVFRTPGMDFGAIEEVRKPSGGRGR